MDESNFASGSFSGATSLARASAAVNNGNLVIGWTASADDAAACWTYFEECNVISGTVTKDAVAQSGAKVLIVDADDNSLTNPYLRDVVTSDGSGNWSSIVPVGRVGFAFAMWDNSGTFYTSPGCPFLTP